MNPLKKLAATIPMNSDYTVQDIHDEHGTFTGNYDECIAYMDNSHRNGYGAHSFRMTNNTIGTVSEFNYS